jgi:hypothetical protein
VRLAKLRKLNITCSLFFVEPRPKMMRMMIVTIMGHEYYRETVGIIGGGEEERILKGEED